MRCPFSYRGVYAVRWMSLGKKNENNFQASREPKWKEEKMKMIKEDFYWNIGTTKVAREAFRIIFIPK